MADTNIIQADEVITDDNQQQNNQNAAPDAATTALQNAMWGDPVDNNQQQPPSNAGEGEPQQQPNQQTQQIVTNADTDTFDEVDYLKKTFDVDSIDAIKAERDELKKLREQKPQELKFENEFSDKLFKAIQAGKTKEITKMLAEQERIEEIMGREVGEDSAEDFIKMGMQLKYKDLTQKEIEYKFNKEFGIPKEPVQRDGELDDEYEERKSEWQERVNDIKMSRVIEAKLLKPEIENSKSKIVFPELPQNTNVASKPTQEELDTYKKHYDSFVQTAETTVNSLNGFSVQVKDKDVDYTVGYTPSQEEKTLINAKLKAFADSGFNANDVFADRWVKEDGTLNVNAMTEDLLKIYSSDKASHKLVSDAVNKRMELYLKDKKNIRIDGNNGDFVPDAKSPSEKLQESFWGN